jgi:CRISP-associated protein Cas1
LIRNAEAGNRRDRRGIDTRRKDDSPFRRDRKPAEKSTVEEVMGVEGFAARSYFSAFGRLLSGGFVFRGRAFHPPPDPVNALLSFGYMMLFNEISSLLEAFGFDIYLGFLHSISRGRASLATDLMEEFRSPVVDRLTVYLINLGVVRPEQFAPGERGGVRMDDAARKAYVKNFEKFMTAEFVERRSDETNTFRKIIRGNIAGLEKHLLEGEPYRPFLLRT